MFRKLEDIEVWKRARGLAVSIYKLAMQEPLCRDWGLRDQMQRSAVSIASNIAEGYERNSQVEFRLFLHIAKGSSGELETQLLILKDLNLISESDINDLIRECSEIRRMIGGLAGSLMRKK